MIDNKLNSLELDLKSVPIIETVQNNKPSISLLDLPAAPTNIPVVESNETKIGNLA